MDRTRDCGSRNVGSIPTESTKQRDCACLPVGRDLVIEVRFLASAQEKQKLLKFLFFC